VSVEPAAPRRRRGRRAAGRPAGAPAAASEAVDIIVREPSAANPDGPPAWDSGADGSNGHAANANGEVPSANGDADGSPGESADTAEPVAAASVAPASVAPASVAPASPPRRRRAASRPAGPAAGVAAAEPLIVSIPAEQHSS
jgi:ribonuclease E